MEDIAAAANRLKRAYQSYIEANMAYNKLLGMTPNVVRSMIWVKVPKRTGGAKWKTKKIK